jgi:hypothetical protein
VDLYEERRDRGCWDGDGDGPDGRGSDEDDADLSDGVTSTTGSGGITAAFDSSGEIGEFGIAGKGLWW